MNSTRASLTSIIEALGVLRHAHEEALAELPEELKREEWIQRITVVEEATRWNVLYYRHDYHPTLFILREICTALAGLTTTLTIDDQPPATPPNLKLGKARSSFAGHTGGGKVDPRYDKG